MQRSFTYKKTFIGLIYFTAFALYMSLSSIYLLLPPLFGILFFYYIYAVEHNRTDLIVLIAFFLLLFEAEKGFTLFSTIIYFFIIYELFIPKLHQYVHCVPCRNAIYVILAYIGYWLFAIVIHEIFWMPLPSVDWHIIYYIVIEFLIMSLL